LALRFDSLLANASMEKPNDRDQVRPGTIW